MNNRFTFDGGNVSLHNLQLQQQANKYSERTTAVENEVKPWREDKNGRTGKDKSKTQTNIHTRLLNACMRWLIDAKTWWVNLINMSWSHLPPNQNDIKYIQQSMKSWMRSQSDQPQQYKWFYTNWLKNHNSIIVIWLNGLSILTNRWHGDQIDVLWIYQDMSRAKQTKLIKSY